MPFGISGHDLSARKEWPAGLKGLDGSRLRLQRSTSHLEQFLKMKVGWAFLGGSVDLDESREAAGRDLELEFSALPGQDAMGINCDILWADFDEIINEPGLTWPRPFQDSSIVS